MRNTVKVGLIQMKCSQNIDENLKHAIIRIKHISKRGAHIICLPELFLTQYFCQTANRKFFQWAEGVPDGPTTKILSEISKRTRSVIIASLFEKDRNKKYFNTAIVIDVDGRFVGKYRKMHIPDDLKHYYGESYYFEKGNLGFRSFKTRYAKVGVLVCWDQWYPEAARILASQGAQIIFYPTAIGFQPKDPTGVNKAEHTAWQIIQQSHAIANNIFVASCNRVGRERHINFWGCSFVCDPYGRILEKAPRNREADVIVNCDLSLISQMRKDWPFLKERRAR